MLNAAIVITLVLTIVDLLVVIVKSKEPTSHPRRFGNPYINLDAAYRNRSVATGTHPPIINHSRHFIQVETKDPIRTLPSSIKYESTSHGEVPVLHRMLVVNQTVRTRQFCDHWTLLIDSVSRYLRLFNFARWILAWSSVHWL